MARYVTITLTEKEAACLLHALGNTTEFADVMESCFDGFDQYAASTSIAACYRAEKKIIKALKEQ